MVGFSELLKPELHKDPEDIEFHSVRSRVIGAYGGLEQGLCGLFFHLMGGSNAMPGNDWQKAKSEAAQNFFKMYRTEQRLDSLETKLQAKFGNTYSRFWKSLRTHVEEIAKRRNEIVHWHIARVIGDHAPYHQLVPPNFWGMSPSSKRFTTRTVCALAGPGAAGFGMRGEPSVGK
jgi:hypothetical protein